MDEQDFKTRADTALDHLYRRLAAASETYDLEPDFNAGALSVEFEEPPGKFVVSPNTPVRQIWVSALTRSFKLGWEDSRQAFVLPETGETLDQLMAAAIGKHLGQTVTL